jgi:cell division transport system permease protein
MAVGSAISALPELTLAPWQWAVLLLLPVVAGITALATARLTVLRSLASMP